MFASFRVFGSRKAVTSVLAAGLACLVAGCFIDTGAGPDATPGQGGNSTAPATNNGDVASTPNASAGSASATSSSSMSNAARVNRFLDDWHHAASVADEVNYFGAMTPDGVFVGTDKKEHWTRQEFIDAFQDKHFVNKEEAWTYYPQSRNLHFAPGDQMAWFDEKLLAKSGFHMRGSGVVLLQADGNWKIAHYVMSFPIPNEVADSMLDIVTAFEKDGTMPPKKDEASFGFGQGSQKAE